VSRVVSQGVWQDLLICYVANGASGGSEPLAGSEPQAQAPLGPAISPIASAVPLASPLYGSPAAPMPSASTQSSTFNQVPPTATINPDALSAKSIPPPAAYAVPSALAAVVLVAGGLFLKRRRKMAAHRTQKPLRTSSCKSSSSSSSEVSHALHVLSRHHGYGSQKDRPPTQDVLPYPTYAQWGSPSDGYVAHHRDPPNHADSPSVQLSGCNERPRLPPIATTNSFLSANDQATHAVLADYLPPSPPLPSSTSTPRCLLPAPQKLHLRDDASQSYLTDNPLGSPPADRDRSERELYARVASKLNKSRRS
jgi:hypothetical protein